MEIICSFLIVLVLFLVYDFVKYYIRVNVALSIPGLFNQIFTILILIDDPMTHVVYAPIPGNRQRIYIRFFTLLHDKFNDLSLQFSPSSAIADFETTVHNSIREVFPCITTKGCFFPLTQAVWSQVQLTGQHISSKKTIT